ncbi:hypothetical protein IAT38_004462 [Cryptococcus sp. DSM 104549]
MFEPGTSSVQFKDQSIMGSNHSFLVTPGGAVETLTGPLSEAHLAGRKPEALTVRILHSLQGTPTELSQPDFLGVVGAVKRAESNASTEVSKNTFEGVLRALQSAREAQQSGGPGAMFELDLSNMPYSMQPRTEHSWVRNADRDINTLARWALIHVSRAHADGSHSTVQPLKIDPGNLSLGDLFSRDQRYGLKHRLDKVIDELYDAGDTENSCSPDAVIGWGIHVPLCTDYSDCTHNEREHEMAQRFARTILSNHRAQPYRFDVALSTAAKGTSLTRHELRDLMPDDLVEEYDEYSSIKIVPASREASMVRPTSFIGSEDEEALAFWEQLTHNRIMNQCPDPKVKHVPTEGYESLLKHVRMIRAGKGEEAWEARYGKNSRTEAMSHAYANRGIRGFDYWLENTAKDAFEDFTVQVMESTLPPQAYVEWSKLQAAGQTGGLSLNEYAIRRKEETEGTYSAWQS